jgi:hypothetical protein
MKTKKAQRVKVKWNVETWTQTRSEYQCPACRTVCIGTLNKRVVRFICECGQELIIE